MKGTKMSIRQVTHNLRALNVPSPGAAVRHTQMSAADCKDCTTASSRQTRMKNALWQQHRRDAAVAGTRAKPPRPTAKPLD
jgi:hypothetical protein